MNISSRARAILRVLPVLAVASTLLALPAEAASKAAPAAKSKTVAATGAKVDLNTASQKDLEALPGVGAATAKKIIAGRPYAAVADLSKAGVTAKQIDKISSLVTVSAAAPAPAAPAAPTAAAAPVAKTAPASAASAAPKASATQPAQPPPAPGMVWVNLSTKVFHRAGDRWYGNTKKGQYMTEADALAAGYREAKSGGKPKPQ